MMVLTCCSYVQVILKQEIPGNHIIADYIKIMIFQMISG